MTLETTKWQSGAEKNIYSTRNLLANFVRGWYISIIKFKVKLCHYILLAEVKTSYFKQ